MTRDDLAMYCTPVLAIAAAMKLDIATPHFPASVEGYVSWFLTGLIAGLTPIVGAGAASIYNRAKGAS